jgi:hypothetical protein
MNYKPNLANNLFASACDSRRPIIALRHLLLALPIKLLAFSKLALVQLGRGNS